MEHHKRPERPVRIRLRPCHRLELSHHLRRLAQRSPNQQIHRLGVRRQRFDSPARINRPERQQNPNRRAQNRHSERSSQTLGLFLQRHAQNASSSTACRSQHTPRAIVSDLYPRGRRCQVQRVSDQANINRSHQLAVVAVFFRVAQHNRRQSNVPGHSRLEHHRHQRGLHRDRSNRPQYETAAIAEQHRPAGGFAPANGRNTRRQPGQSHILD